MKDKGESIPEALRSLNRELDALDRRRMTPRQRVELWLRVHDIADVLFAKGEDEFKVAQRVAFEIDMEVQTVRRVMRQRLK